MEKASETSGIAKATLDNFKDKYGDLIHVIQAPTNKDETKFIEAVVKSPENDRNVCGAIENKIDKNFSQARLVAVQNCVLYNKEEVLNNNIAFRAVSEFIFELIPSGKARVKN